MRPKKKPWWLLIAAGAALLAVVLILALSGKAPSDDDRIQPHVTVAVEEYDSAAPPVLPTQAPAADQKTTTEEPSAVFAPTAVPTAIPTSKPTAAPIARLDQPKSELFRLYDENFRWYYAHLTAKERFLFADLYDGIAEHRETISLTSGSYTTDQLERVLMVIREDCPELVFFNFEGSQSYTTLNEWVDSVTPLYTYETPEESRRNTQAVLEKIDSLLTAEERRLGEADKEYLLYTRIISAAVYDDTFEYNRGADSVLIYGKAKCSGFASTFNLACRYYGIESIYVKGTGITPEGSEGHAWNMVHIEGEWYICDPTWDHNVYECYREYPEPINGLLFYFNQTYHKMKDSHIAEAANRCKLPNATAAEASYWNRFYGGANAGKNWKQVLISQINEAVRGQRQAILLHFDKPEQYQAALAAYEAALTEWRQISGYNLSYSTIKIEENQAFAILHMSFTPGAMHENGMYVRFLNVEDADAALVYCEGHYMLIDGGTAKLGSRLLYSLLETGGITSVDAIIATHPHSDHVGGISGALSYEGCSFGTIYSPVKASDNNSFNDMLEKAAQRGVPMEIPDMGDHFRLGNAIVTFISPDREMSYENVNNKSLVVRIDYGQTSFLFTGDAMLNAEDDMLSSGQPLRANVLKVAHHGADTSSGTAFLNAVSPNLAIISCSADKPEHPSQQTLSRLQSLGVCCLRTDENGSIIVYSNGEQITYSTEK